MLLVVKHFFPRFLFFIFLFIYIIIIISNANNLWWFVFPEVVWIVIRNYLQCLSPAGEYNLRLGIIKELHPDMVATYSGRLYLIF